MAAALALLPATHRRERALTATFAIGQRLTDGQTSGATLRLLARPCRRRASCSSGRTTTTATAFLRIRAACGGTLGCTIGRSLSRGLSLFLRSLDGSFGFLGLAASFRLLLLAAALFLRGLLLGFAAGSLFRTTLG